MSAVSNLRSGVLVSKKTDSGASALRLQSRGRQDTKRSSLWRSLGAGGLDLPVLQKHWSADTSPFSQAWPRLKWFFDYGLRAVWASNPHHPKSSTPALRRQASVATQCCCCRLASKSKDPCCLLPACFWGDTLAR